MASVRSASMAGLADLVAELGGDARDLARRHGLPDEALWSPDVRVPVDAMARLFEGAALELGCPDLGVRLAERQQLDGLGPLAVAIRHAPDMADALACAQRFLTLHNQGSTLALEADPYGVSGVTGLRFAWHHEGPAYPQTMDKVLVNVHRVITTLAGPAYGLRSVELSYPPAAPLARYEAAFGGVRVNAGRPTTMLRVSRELRARPIQGADAGVRAMALYYLRDQPAPGGLDRTAAVRSALEALLGTGRTSVAWVARHLETSPRSLQRGLAEEGATYGGLLDDARRERAGTLLAETDLSLGEVAAMLDLGSQATFSKAARRWWGTAPSQRRRELVRAVPRLDA